MTAVVDQEAVRGWGSASEAELITAQILAVDAWLRAWGRHAAPAGVDSRQDQTERRRKALVVETIRQAIQDRTRHALDAVPRSQPGVVAPRLVIAHRSPWFADKLSAALAARGVQLVARPVNGAEAVGVVIAEQPDLLVIEDTMALMTGEQVLSQALQFAPRTLVAVQVQERDRALHLSEAGAAVTFVRAVPPADVAGDLAALVEAHRHAAAAVPSIAPRRGRS